MEELAQSTHARDGGAVAGVPRRRPGSRRSADHRHPGQPALVRPLGEPGTWIRDLIVNGYRRSDGGGTRATTGSTAQPLGEQQPQVAAGRLREVPALRQRKIDQAGEGIVAFVTNHSYLENPTFRGLRRSLMRPSTRSTSSTSAAHGSSGGGSGKGWAPERDGEPDENVFPEVSRGVVIALLVKLPPGRSTRACPRLHRRPARPPRRQGPPAAGGGRRDHGLERDRQASRPPPTASAPATPRSRRSTAAASRSTGCSRCTRRAW